MVLRTAFADLLQAPKIQALWSDGWGEVEVEGSREE